ncbi:hypothetical protein Tco_0908576 [Tanacetum coccineum]|uniref:MAK10-like protein n=1 Tax=Tanacetum coccineum TaxID=301880 RepID=A0ABQ5CMM3_9ASTR
MGDENPIRTLGDYSKPSHEGYRNTIELPVENNVVPLRSDTIRLVQNGCSFHGLQSKDPNQHLKDFLKLVDSLDLDGENRKRTRLQELALYENESWIDPRDFAKPVKAIVLPQDVSSTSDHCLIELKNQVQRLMEAHLALTQPTQVNKITTSCEICSGPHNTQYCMENPEQAFVEYASSRTDEAGGSLELGKNGSTFIQGEVPAKMEDPRLFTLPCRLGDSKPFDTLADLGSCVNIIPLYLFKKLNIGLLEETGHVFRLADKTKSYPKDLETPLLVGRGFLATANAVIDCRMAKITVGEGITREWEIARDAELNPFKDTLVFRRMVEFLGAIPINLKSNMWELEDLIKNPINWDKPPKNGDGAWHAKIILIDPDKEEFTKTLQSIPTTRKLSERESPRKIINLDHFYDT